MNFKIYTVEDLDCPAERVPRVVCLPDAFSLQYDVAVTVVPISRFFLI